MRAELISTNWEQLPWQFGYERMKSYLRIYDDSANSEHAGVVDLLIRAAIRSIQTYTRLQLVRATYRQIFTELPAELSAFPLIGLTKFEWWTGTTWTEITATKIDVEKAFDAYASGNWQYFVSNEQPPKLKGQAVTNALAYRLTWEAGFIDWPEDLILLVMQVVSENFDVRGVSDTKSIQFTRAHQLALDQYCTHHDALRWA